MATTVFGSLMYNATEEELRAAMPTLARHEALPHADNLTEILVTKHYDEREVLIADEPLNEVNERLDIIREVLKQHGYTPVPDYRDEE